MVLKSPDFSWSEVRAAPTMNCSPEATRSVTSCARQDHPALPPEPRANWSERQECSAIGRMVTVRRTPNFRLLTPSTAPCSEGGCWESSRRQLIVGGGRGDRARGLDDLVGS